MDLGLSIFLAWGGAIAAGSLIGLAICCFFYVDDEYDESEELEDEEEKRKKE